MSDPLATLRGVADTPGQAVRWACVLEATAPKAGNVYPGKPFDDLTHHDFLLAADIAAKVLGDCDRQLGQRVLDAVQQTVKATGTNVNLGILLLVCPLVVADQARAGDDCLSLAQWRPAIDGVLAAIDSRDGRNVFAAIHQSAAGGLGVVTSMDVHHQDPQHIDLMAAMQQAASYDRIAAQYATGYADLIDHVLPVLRSSMVRCGDVLGGIAATHLQLLAAAPDTLIARKNGVEVAEQVKNRAGQVVADDPQSVAQFDAYLRSDQHRLNPGTTADLIAAAIYLMLRTSPEDSDD